MDYQLLGGLSTYVIMGISIVVMAKVDRWLGAFIFVGGHIGLFVGLHFLGAL